MNILGIIPARGGSKGIPRKNIQPLGGRPLIAWTIESALSSRCLDQLVLSTEDPEIARVGRECGASVPFLRPLELAQDDTPTLPVLQDVVRRMEADGYHPDVVVTLQPTSPLRGSEHIDQAVDLLLGSNADSVISVCLAEHSPYWMHRLDGDRLVPLLPDDPSYTRRQKLPPVYRRNGAVYATRYPVLMEQNRILGADTRALVMDWESSVDIDSPIDLKLAELILQERGERHANRR